jgi:hypothetical protein
MIMISTTNKGYDMKHLTEALLIIKMQELVIKHLEDGHELNETISIIQTRGAMWRQRAHKLLKEIEQNEAWLHSEREQRQISFDEVLEDSLKVIENNLVDIAQIIEEY